MFLNPRQRYFIKQFFSYLHGKNYSTLFKKTKTHFFSFIQPLPINVQYKVWLKKNRATAITEMQIKEELKSFFYTPIVSVLMPTYNSDVKWLKRAIESVLSQIYPYWELCIADDGSCNCEQIREVVDDYVREDERIKFRSLKSNHGISTATNEALAMAEGEYVAFLDHDDELSPDALFQVVKLLSKHPEADIIYSDEDKIDEKGKRYDPHFKPDWSPDLFLSVMYTCHLGVYRSLLVRDVGGLRKGFEGAQDYDLVLRLTERTQNVFHIPKILYHWRMLSGSTAMNQHVKDYAYESAKKALKEVLVRRNIEGEVLDGIRKSSYRIRRKTKEAPLVSIIIPTKDNKCLLEMCIDSILEKTEYKNYEILIVNNASQDPVTLEYLKNLSHKGIAKILNYDKSFNFAAINNFAVRSVQGKHLLFLNDDVEIISNEWLAALVEHSQREEVGAVGVKLLYPSGKIQHAGIMLGVGGVAGHAYKYSKKDDASGLSYRKDVIQNVSAVTAACLMTRKEIFNEVKGFDEINLPVSFNDVDFCLKIRQRGYLIVYTPYAILYHHESASRGYEGSDNPRFKKEVEHMREKWGTILYEDPYYNPNLTLNREDFGLKI